MIRVKLRQAMETYQLTTGQRLTYARLAELSGVGEGTLSSIGSRVGYNVTIGTIEKICRVLDVAPGDLLEIIDDPPKPKRKAKKPRARGKGRKYPAIHRGAPGTAPSTKAPQGCPTPTEPARRATIPCRRRSVTQDDGRTTTGHR